MSIFSTQSTIPNHSGPIELPAGSLPGHAPVAPSAQEIVESVLTQLVESEPDHDIPEHEIAVEAYFLFEARGFAHGHDVEDWLAAEALVRQRRMSPIVAAIELGPDQRN
jgi:hypothetical protein